MEEDYIFILKVIILAIISIGLIVLGYFFCNSYTTGLVLGFSIDKMLRLFLSEE